MLKSISVAPLVSNIWKIFWELCKSVGVGKLLTEYRQKRSGALIKLGDVATKLHNSVEVNVKSLSDDDSYDEE